MKSLGNFAKFYKNHNINTWVIFLFMVYLVLIIKAVTLRQFPSSIFFAGYSAAVSLYLLSRFALAFLHINDKDADKFYKPSVSVGVPSKDEGANIRQTILKIAQSSYPKEKLDIIAINDGSTDNTLEEMKKAKEIAAKIGVKVRIINWKVNQGKRQGMAECIRQSNKEIIVFIDSDSFVEKNTIKELVKYFINKKIGAVAGHAFVANADKNILTKMQAVRYFVSFKAFKAAESLFGNVTCCSGCCSAYRREYVLKFLDNWLNQRFLGAKCTYGDDRSLTNYLLKTGYDTIFSPSAIAYTIVPDSFSKFMKQQLRWKKSWTRETIIASSFMWKKNPIASFSFYLGFILPILAPIIVARALVWYPYYTHGQLPIYYIFGLLVVSVMYGIYYNAYTKDNKWFYGAIFTLFYTLILIWQLPYAILTIRDSRWGTR